MLIYIPLNKSYELMQDGSIEIIVERKNDIKIVELLLEAAKYPKENIVVTCILGKKKLKSFVSGLSSLEQSCAVLVNKDAKSVQDAVLSARKNLGDPSVQIFCAIPEVEAWLFADERTALENTKSHWIDVVSKFELPEEIKSPQSHAERAFENLEFLKDIDINRAAARSPSLRSFLDGIEQMLAAQPTVAVESISRNISKDVFAGLIYEVIPANTIIWQTASGDSLTAYELRRQIEEGTETGRQYASDVLRVARDFLKRKANRSESK